MTVDRVGSLSPLADSVNAVSTGRLPIFRYSPPRAVIGGFGSIYIGNTLFHRIKNIEEFYAVLGFKPDANGGGVVPDEFVWDRYTRDGASKSGKCLQVRIAVYLHANSAEFIKLYGRAYDEMIGKCDCAGIDDGDDNCFNCPMHPPTER